MSRISTHTARGVDAGAMLTWFLSALPSTIACAALTRRFTNTQTLPSSCREPLEETCVAAERLRKDRAPIPGLSTRVTASFGVAALPNNGTSPETLVRSADAALYEAKQRGRNQVRRAEH